MYSTRNQIEEYIPKTPSQFSLPVLNPENNLVFGDTKATFASVYDPHYAYDREWVRDKDIPCPQCKS